MNKYVVIFTVLISYSICSAQRCVCVKTSSMVFDEDTKTYSMVRNDMDQGTLYIFEIASNKIYECAINGSRFMIPNSVAEKECTIALYYNGKYYFTDMFMLDSLAMSSPNWFLVIEEGEMSKKILGNKYFALSIPPFEYGKLLFKNTFFYHRKAKKVINKAKKKRVIVSQPF